MSPALRKLRFKATGRERSCSPVMTPEIAVLTVSLFTVCLRITRGATSGLAAVATGSSFNGGRITRSSPTLTVMPLRRSTLRSPRLALRV